MLRRVSFALILRERTDASNEISQRHAVARKERGNGTAELANGFFRSKQENSPLSSDVPPCSKTTSLLFAREIASSSPLPFLIMLLVNYNWYVMIL
jgi:hypothetical protein